MSSRNDVVQGQVLELRSRKRTSKKQKSGSGGTEQGFQGKTSRVREKEEWEDRNRAQGTGRGFWERKKKSKGQEWCQRFRIQGTGKGPKAQKRGSRDRRWPKRQREGLRDKKEPEVRGLRDSRV